MIRLLVLTSVLCVLAAGCEDVSSSGPTATSSNSGAYDDRLPSPESFAAQYPAFDSYWYQGRAELTRYALRQARYGEQHDGESVLVFVTEDFLRGRQVKKEHGDAPDAVSVLKLNAYRRFYTGIYPYTLMTSSFTPALAPRGPTLKLSSSIQEWCGHVYTQINLRDDGLHAVSHSYFQDDADQKTVLPTARLEDGIWAQIRIDPSAIPLGKQDLIPALDYIRMRHKALRAYPAEVIQKPEVKTDLVDHPVAAVQVKYPALGRDLTIYYEPKFPHVIQAWEENVGPQRTTAVRSRSIIDDYWNHNSADDSWYREALGLTQK